MVLVDTSVWVAHFKASNAHLSDLLRHDEVACHSLIIAEIACGTPPNPRQRTLSDFALLHQVNEVTMQELLVFIENNTLYGKGCGYVDIALLAATVLTKNTQIWALDKRLNALAIDLNISFNQT